ncbi:ImmA/IrrE family metallo-endopeptidase [Tannockella kyphosi]|uniref:ImmA/IrrE family metallo-endopeptidase n=1 Tax=Tannockella kyphosi TaxID=2899121 RepID=UPI0020133239|nr:ImmA/IrrE family metallo-endopeptidase [Tannockella kyphosi]
MKKEIELNSYALKVRKWFNEDAYSPIDIFAHVNAWKEMKITIIYYPLSSRISGMCTKTEDYILIGINSETSLGRQRFSLAHELYHVLFEEGLKNVVCDMKLKGEKNDSEKEADMFASYLLMPYDALRQYQDGVREWTIEEIIRAEQFFQISHTAMLLRLCTENYISYGDYDKFSNIGITREAMKLGYEPDLYMKSPNNKKYFTTGEYIRIVEEIAQKELVSNGKRAELLLDAYRSDIVYGISDEGVDLNE